MARKHGFFRPHVNGLTAIHSTTLRDGGTWVLSGSQLDLDFAYDRAFNRSTGFNGSPNGILTYTSPSPKLVYGDDGVLRYANHNRLFQSADFTNASWTKTGTSVSADVVTCTAGGTNHRVSQNTSVSGQQRVFFDVKAGTHSFVQIYDGGSTDNYATFNLSSGAVGSVGAATTASITALGDGYYRCAVTYSSSGAPNGNCFLAFAVNAASTWGATFSAVGTETISVLRGQLQSAPAPVDFTYIPTTSAAVYSLPIDHDPITHAPLGVLIEEQRTNLALYSEDFSNAAYLKSNTTVTANQVAAPDGNLTADLITPTLSDSSIRQAFAPASATAHTLSIWLKSATGSSFDTTLRMTRTSPFSSIGNTVITVTTAWQRFSFTATALDTTLHEFWIGGSSTLSTGENLHAFGYQIEAGAFATSYIPTVASQVTRAADSITVATSAFGFSSAAGTMVAHYKDPGVNAGLWRIDDSGDAEYMRAIRDTGNIVFAIVDGGVVTGLVYRTATAQGTISKHASTWETNWANAAIDGSVGTEDTSITLPTVSALRIGQNRNVEFLNSHLRRLTYFPTRKSNSELQALSA